MFILASKADHTPYLSLNLHGPQMTCEISRKGSPRTVLELHAEESVRPRYGVPGTNDVHVTYD